MSVTEAQRLHLFKSFEETLPDEDVATLMELLPPSGWDDVATKHDLVLFRQDVVLFRQDLDLVRKDLDTMAATLRAEIAEGFRSHTNRCVGWLLVSNTAVVAAVAAITAAS